MHNLAQRFISALALSASLSGCALLPSAAPTMDELTSIETAPGTPTYFLVDVDPRVAAVLAEHRAPGLASTFGVGSYQPVLILRPGDTVAVTIFELSGPGSLFGQSAPAPPGAQGVPVPTIPSSHPTTLPPQRVELDGTVGIPFAGPVKIANLTPEAAGHAIENALKGKAFEPQVLVSLIATELNLVTVGGDVGAPKTVPLTVRGERVLDVIADAGGAKHEAYDCDVRLIRGGRVATVNLRRIVEDQKENVRMRPGDNIFVSYNPRTYSVLGSALKVSHFDFGHETISIAEAVAQAGGGNDNLTDIGAIYLFRYEPREVIRRVLPPSDPKQAVAAALPAAGNYPIAYHVNLRGAQGYFLSQAVQVHDKDTILLTDASMVEVNKVLSTAHTISEIYFDLIGPTAKGRTLIPTSP